MKGTQSPDTISTKLQRIAELARKNPQEALLTLAHHIDVEFLREAYRRTRKDGATGVDGQTSSDYEARLEENLQALLHRFKSGTYRAPPVRRVYIPKDKGGSRPIGIPTFEDKILQRAVAMVLEAIYEQDFVSWSYGFRPGRSAHQALAAVWAELTKMRGGWVVEVDIQSFFDSVDHGQLRAILDRRVRDGVLRRMIDKWLKAGVLEAGELRYPGEGTPQGGVISPVLANIFLHDVFDRWFDDVVKPRLSGTASAVRYADDVVLLFSSEQEARRVLEVLPKRFGKHGLTLHPEKTRLIDYRRPDRAGGDDDGSRPGTFDLLGFTHHWMKSWRSGKWIVRRRTMRSRFTRALVAIARWCKQHRHSSVPEQHETLSRKLRGHYAYYGITGNADALGRFVHEVERVWQKWLFRRSQRARLRWDAFRRIKQRYPLPPPRVVHSVYRR
jgi:RNA-directed DNA polymerase